MAGMARDALFAAGGWNKVLCRDRRYFFNRRKNRKLWARENYSVPLAFEKGRPPPVKLGAVPAAGK